MKKKFIFCVMVCMIFSLMMHSTLAYFTAEETARNVITSGGIDIQVVECQQADEGPKPYPAEPIKVMPGSEVSKIVSVQNLDEPAWVRMTYSVTLLNADGTEKKLTADEAAKFMAMNTDTENWSFKDGWWYYAHSLSTEEETKPLFTKVSFSGSGMVNTYQNSTVRIDVVAQAVQKSNNGATVTDAAGWPEN